jgi:hypothetical protein
VDWIDIETEKWKSLIGQTARTRKLMECLQESSFGVDKSLSSLRDRATTEDHEKRETEKKSEQNEMEEEQEEEDLGKKDQPVEESREVERDEEEEEEDNLETRNSENAEDESCQDEKLFLTLEEDKTEDSDVVVSCTDSVPSDIEVRQFSMKEDLIIRKRGQHRTRTNEEEQLMKRLEKKERHEEGFDQVEELQIRQEKDMLETECKKLIKKIVKEGKKAERGRRRKQREIEGQKETGTQKRKQRGEATTSDLQELPSLQKPLSRKSLIQKIRALEKKSPTLEIQTAGEVEDIPWTSSRSSENKIPLEERTNTQKHSLPLVSVPA